MQRILTALILLLLISSPLAAMSIWPQPEPTPMPRIKVPAETPIELRSMDVAVRIVGLHAETTQTLQFFNPNKRILAGELECVLPQGAVVSGYALDIDGRMVDGVIVGKQKARMVMDSEQRRRVDPGLVEHVRANLFKTRVYPIPAGGTRTIKIVYVSDLTLRDDDAAYHLPLPRNETVKHLKLSVAIDKGPVKPEIGGYGNVELTDWNDQWKADAEFTNIKADNDFMLRLPKLPQQLVSIETFMGRHYVSINTAHARQTAAAQPRKRVALVWDASASHGSQARVKEIKLLEAALAKWPGCIVDVQVFRNRLNDEIKSFTDSESLTAYLKGLAYDGATDLSKLNFLKAGAPHPDTECWLLVSDGLHTLGNSLPKTGDVPVFTMSAATAQDTAFLRFIATASGGAHISLQQQDLEAALAALSGQQSGVLRLERGDRNIIPNNIFIVNRPAAGRSQVYFTVTDSGHVNLIYRGERQSQRIKLNLADAREGHIIARAWAAQQANALALFPERNKQQLIQLGNQYNLVSPGTSLLVLETLDQYLRHGIQPPDSWPDMQQQYLAALKNQRQQQKQTREQKIQRVLGWWRERVNWWQRDFQVPPGFKVAKKQGKDRDQGNVMIEADEVLEESVATDLDVPPEGRERAAADAAAPGQANRRSGGGFALFGGEKKSKGGDAGSASASMTVQRWDPQTPYLAAIKGTALKDQYATYLQQRDQYAASPGFYLDCAGYFIIKQPQIGLRILSNLAEMKIEDVALLRVYAWRLQEAGQLDRAEEILEQVLYLRDDEPQSHRDLALLLIQRYQQSNNQQDALRAARLLYDVVIKNWQRFAQIEVLALTELNDLLHDMPAALRQQCAFVDQRLIQHLPVDVRIVLSWDADNTDVDLHVFEPSGEKAFYSHNRTSIGGYVSRDFTRGYGPEDYFVKQAMPGTYEIRCHYYGSRQQTLIGPCTVTATVFTNYGRPDEQRQVMTLRLRKPDDTYVVGSITIDPDQMKPGPMEKLGNKKAQPPAHGQLKLEQIKELKIGMTKAAVLRTLGYKGQESNNGMELLSYQLSDGSRVRLAFGPDLLWAHQIHNGAEISLLTE